MPHWMHFWASWYSRTGNGKRGARTGGRGEHEAMMDGDDSPHASSREQVLDVHSSPGESRYRIRGSYEEQLEQMKIAALTVAGLQHLTRYLGVFALTWSTVVLLGGFASALRTVDFYFVTLLLLLELARLGATVVSSKLVTKKLVVQNPHPNTLEYIDKQPMLVAWIKRIAQVTQIVLVLLSLVLASVRFVLGKFDGAYNLRASLFIFYILVLMNVMSASLSILFGEVLRKWICPDETTSLQRYHDEVLKIALTVGFMEADEFDFFAFAFRKLAEDYRRNLPPLVVKEVNSDLIKYLYSHQKGAELVCHFLESPDVFEQEAAANMVGFWAKEERMEKQMVLLTQLADKLGSPGKTAEAAANSFGALAEAWKEKDPSPLVAIRNSKGEGAEETMVGLVMQRRNPTLLVYMRALARYVSNGAVVRGMGEELCVELREKLREIIRERRVRGRTRIMAAYALFKLNGGQLLPLVEDQQLVLSLNPLTEETFILEEEQQMVNELFGSALPIPTPYPWPQALVVRRLPWGPPRSRS